MNTTYAGSLGRNLSTLSVGAFLTIVFALSGCSEPVQSVDLDRVLDVTAGSMDSFDAMGKEGDEAVQAFAVQLEQDLNTTRPSIHPGPIGIELMTDGSFEGYNDKNGDSERASGEDQLFKLEIDAEKQRLIASDTNYTRDHAFSGMGGLLAGALIGGLIGRQMAAGVNRQALSNKTATPRSSYRSARSRAASGGARSRSSSGSHTSGK